MIIRAWADTALVKHPVQCDLIQTFLKQLGIIGTATIVEQGCSADIKLSGLYICFQILCALLYLIRVFLNHRKFVSQCPLMLLLL